MQRLKHIFLILRLGVAEHDDLANVTLGIVSWPFPKKGTTHTCLESVSPSTGQLVDLEDTKRVEPHLK